tara:strand:+ start:498 stop:1001 length:504 start_codon:yes stop_codon:yes gene_type:complete
MMLKTTNAYFKLISAIIGLTALISCGTDDTDYETPVTETPEEAFERNEAEILAYIEANDLEATRTESGLYYVITAEGTGDTPAADADVSVNYKGYFLNENVFDQSTRAVQFNLENVIAGFSEGIQRIQEGGSATLLMPASLAYGVYGSGPIPPYTAIAFDVELLEIQ